MTVGVPNIENKPVLLFDMNGTFMMGHDRLGPDEDFYPSYKSQGGWRLNAEQVNGILHKVVQEMSVLYDDRDRQDHFPQVLDFLMEMPECDRILEQDIARLERTFAYAERGYIPEAYRDVLFKLSADYRLGVVSDIWARRCSWITTFERTGVDEIFETIIFSSDYGCVKPSPRLFEAALSSLNVSADQAYYIGDSYQRDILGAKAAGIDGILIAKGVTEPGEAVAVIPDLTALPGLLNL